MDFSKSKVATLPNIVSLVRIAAVPILIYLAIYGYETTFLVLAAIALATDALDGYLARKLDQITTLGTTLDSVGDMMMYFTMPLCGWFLWPEMIMQEIIYIILVMVAFFVPLFAGLIKFGRMPSYHTILAKFSTIFISIATLIWFIFKMPILFRFAVIIQLMVMTEYIAITIRLKKWQGNIPTFWHIDK